MHPGPFVEVSFNPFGSHFFLLFAIVRMFYIVVTSLVSLVILLCRTAYVRNPYALPQMKERSIWQEISIIVRKLRRVQKLFFSSRKEGGSRADTRHFEAALK